MSTVETLERAKGTAQRAARTVQRAFRTTQQLYRSSRSGHLFASYEANRACNRACSYCSVPQQYVQEAESTVGETKQHIDWFAKQGYSVLNYVGGEPLAPFKTKEGITFLQHTVQAIRHATDLGMLVNVTTNGDYAKPEVLRELAEAGLDTLTFSLHSYNEKGFDYLLQRAKAAARFGIIPVVSIVFTQDRTDSIPLALAKLAYNGVLGSTTIVQEKGGGFSSTPEVSNIPSTEQQREVLSRLMPLKAAGFIRNNWNYLTHAPDYPGNSWTCDPEQDSFIHVGAGGTADVCSEVRTNVNILNLMLDSKEWRQAKKDLVAHCGNCLYSCNYETENPDLVGDLPTLLVMSLIKTGHADLAERWGQHMVSKIVEDPESAWQPKINNGESLPAYILLPNGNMHYLDLSRGMGLYIKRDMSAFANQKMIGLSAMFSLGTSLALYAAGAPSEMLAVNAIIAPAIVGIGSMLDSIREMRIRRRAGRVNREGLLLPRDNSINS